MAESPATPPNAARTTEARILWKGAISFGLVHIPVALYSATSSSDLDFDWLDSRTMEPVGYKRINKKTGKEIAAKDIVKGIEVEDGRYVVLSPEEIAAAFPKATQTIDIEAFIQAAEIPFVYLERPYYIAPINRGEKVYALLREALLASGKVGIARVVIHTKQHLAVLVPAGQALVLNLLRWGGDVRSWEALKLPPAGTTAAGIKPAEMEMAKQLIDEMSAQWHADSFRDSFKEEILRLVELKASEGKVERVEKDDAAAEPRKSAEIIDLTELLRRSLRGEDSNGRRKASANASSRPTARKRGKAGAGSTGGTAARAAGAGRVPAKRSA